MIILDIEDMRQAHKFTNNNYELLQTEQNCRCIYCLKEYRSTLIDEFTMDNNALCPYCWVDAVIGESSGYSYTDDEASMMYEFFFRNSGDISEHILDLNLLEKFKDLL